MANQYEADPRQALFLKNYLDPKSSTFSNALQSALRAGYSQEYSENILQKDLDWLSDNVGRRKRIVEKAENNLDSLLDEEDKRVKADMTKFALSRLKKETYSDRVEHTGEGGGDINISISKEVADKHETT